MRRVFACLFVLARSSVSFLIVFVSGKVNFSVSFSFFFSNSFASFEKKKKKKIAHPVLFPGVVCTCHSDVVSHLQRALSDVLTIWTF